MIGRQKLRAARSRATRRDDLPSPRVAPRDLLSEAVAGLLARPGRAALTVLGTVLGVAALVATLGISKTASNQIVGRFDELAATDVSVTAKTVGPTATPVIPFDAEVRVGRLNGVVAVGTLGDVNINGELVRSVPVNDPLVQTAIQLPVKAASPGLYRAVRAIIRSGRLPDAGNSARGDRVAVLGPSAAERLGLRRVDQQPAIFIGDHLYLVVGILEDVARQPDLLGAVIIPDGTAVREFALAAPSSVQVETKIGAAALISTQAPIAVSRNDPTLVKVTSPPEPRKTRTRFKGISTPSF